MKSLIFCLLLSSAIAGAQTAPPIEKPQIAPLDATTEKILKNSPLAPQVTELNAKDKDFEKKVETALQKLGPAFPLKKPASVYFVYDCLFLEESGLQKKYTQLSKPQLESARKTVMEVFKQ